MPSLDQVRSMRRPLVVISVGPFIVLSGLRGAHLDSQSFVCRPLGYEMVIYAHIHNGCTFGQKSGHCSADQSLL